MIHEENQCERWVCILATRVLILGATFGTASLTSSFTLNLAQNLFFMMHKTENAYSPRYIAGNVRSFTIAWLVSHSSSVTRTWSVKMSNVLLEQTNPLQSTNSSWIWSGSEWTSALKGLPTNLPLISSHSGKYNLSSLCKRGKCYFKKLTENSIFLQLIMQITQSLQARNTLLYPKG